MPGDLVYGGMPHGQELRDKGSGARDAMVAPQLKGEEYEDAEEGTDSRYVEKVLDVSVPCGFEVVISAAAGGRRRCGYGHGRAEIEERDLGFSAREREL